MTFHVCRTVSYPSSPATNTRPFTITGTQAEVAAKISGLIEAGASEILYLPAGPDVPRELRAFAAAARQIPS